MLDSSVTVKVLTIAKVTSLAEPTTIGASAGLYQGQYIPIYLRSGGPSEGSIGNQSQMSIFSSLIVTYYFEMSSILTRNKTLGVRYSMSNQQRGLVAKISLGTR